MFWKTLPAILAQATGEGFQIFCRLPPRLGRHLVLIRSVASTPSYAGGAVSTPGVLRQKWLSVAPSRGTRDGAAEVLLRRYLLLGAESLQQW